MKKGNRLFYLVLIITLFITLNSTFLSSTPSQDFEEIELTFSNPEFFKTDGYDFIRVSGASFTWDIGKPMLPVKGVQVLVEDKEIDRVEIVSFESEILEGSYYIRPVQYPVANFTMPKVEPDSEVYDSDSVYPFEVFEVASVSKMRDYPILNLLIYPLQYKPESRELTFYRSLRLRIYYKQEINIKSASQLAKEKRHESELFDNVVKNTVVNPDKVGEIKSERDSQYSISGSYSVQVSPTYCSGLPTNWVDELKYLIITGHGVVDEASEPNFEELERLVEWKKKKGIPAKLANYTDIISSDVFNCEGQDNAERVRNFIKDVYDMWGIEYVLLGGRSVEVPVRSGYGYVSGTTGTIETDLYFADLNTNSNWSSDGDSTWGETTDTVDLTPDVFIGRPLIDSISGTTGAQNFVDKILRYEKNPPTNYLTTVLFLAELLDSDNDAASSTNYTNATFVPGYWNATMLYESINVASTAVDEFHDNNNEANATAAINKGYHIINHDGHGSEDALGVGAGNEQITNFGSFTNDINYSIFYTASCDSIKISGTSPARTCIQNNQGCLTWVGSTDLGWYSDTASSGPYAGCNEGSCFYSGEFNHQWFNETFNGNSQNLGVITARSKNYFVPQAGSYNAYRWLIYSINLIGDPETPVWTNVPENLSVSYSVNGQTVSSMQVNETVNFTVQVTNLTGGNALSGARVCVWQGDNIYNYTTTDASGNAVFELTPNTTGDVNVTITKQNFFPLEENASVVDEDLTAPTTTLNLPDDFFNTSSLEITFNFTSFDNINLSNVSLWHNFTDWAINESNVSAVNGTDNVWESINFTEGQFVWGVLACDNSSNCGWSNNRTFTIDVTEPLISLEAPDNNSANTTSNSIDFTFNVTDFLDIVNCSLMVNDEENFTLNITPKDSAGLNITVWLNSGDYNWSVNCSDLVGNYNGTFIYNLSVVDEVKPEVSLDSPADNLETSTNALDANFTVTEVYLDTCELWGNWSDGWHLNQSYDGFVAGLTQNFTNVSVVEGQFVWSVYCNDSSNNYNNSVGNRTFTIDNTGPTVSLKNPVDSESWGSGTVTFTYQVSDPSSVSSCALYIDSGQNSTSSSITKDSNQTFTSTLFNSTYDWFVRCTDGAGNSADSETRSLVQACGESWSCGSWSTCSGGTQSRSCTDSNGCPAGLGSPATSQSCDTGGGGGAGGGGGGGGGAGGVVSGFDIDFSIQRARSIRTSEGAVSTLSFDGVTSHSLKIDKVTANSVTITISSEPVTVMVSLGQTVTIDLNKDGIMDLEITLDSVMGKAVDIVVVKLTGADILAKEDELASKQKFSLSKKEIRTEITQGETVTETFRIRNDGIETLALDLEVSPELKGYVVLNKDSVILGKGESQTIEVNFLAPATLEPKLYAGKIIIGTDLKQLSLPLQMNVKKREALFDVKVKIPEKFKEVYPGESVVADITLLNIGKIGQVDVEVYYTIKNQEGTIITSSKETVGVEVATSFTKTLTLPKDVIFGNHTYFVNITYKDTSTTGEDYFIVKREIPIIPKFIQQRFYELLVWVVGGLLLLVIFFVVRERYLKKMIREVKGKEERLEKEFKEFKKTKRNKE